jgi:hypothetical protein
MEKMGIQVSKAILHNIFSLNETEPAKNPPPCVWDIPGPRSEFLVTPEDFL